MSLTENEINTVLEMACGNGFWGDASEVLTSLGVHYDGPRYGSKGRRTYAYLEAANDEAADQILQYFEVGKYKPDTSPWSGRGLKLFVSHRDCCKAELALVASELERFGILAFLAHDSIEAGKPWRNELYAGLATMDALLAYCSEGFSESEWTGQEVGFAFGKSVPTVAVMAGEGPKGLLEQIQAKKLVATDEKSARELAQFVFESLKTDDRAKPALSEGLARKLKLAGTFGAARFYAEQLADLGVLPPQALSDVRRAIDVNNQMDDAKANEAFMALLAAA